MRTSLSSEKYETVVPPRRLASAQRQSAPPCSAFSSWSPLLPRPNLTKKTLIRNGPRLGEQYRLRTRHGGVRICRIRYRGYPLPSLLLAIPISSSLNKEDHFSSSIRFSMERSSRPFSRRTIKTVCSLIRVQKFLRCFEATIRINHLLKSSRIVAPFVPCSFLDTHHCSREVGRTFFLVLPPYFCTIFITPALSNAWK